MRQTKRRRTRDTACQTLTYRELRDYICAAAAAASSSSSSTRWMKVGVAPGSPSLGSVSTMSAYGGEMLPTRHCELIYIWLVACVCQGETSIFWGARAFFFTCVGI